MKTDIISPTSDSALPPRTSPEQARKQGRFGYDKPTAQNTINTCGSMNG